MKSIKVLFLVLCVNILSPIAEAKDFNLGVKGASGETAMLSLIATPVEIKLRVAVSARNLQCSEFRRDFCGAEDDVAMIEGSFKPEDCVIISATLFRCNIESFGGRGLRAIFKDGYEKVIQSPAGFIAVQQVRSVDFRGNEQVINLLKLDIWGGRADGLDPIITSEPDSIFFEPAALDEVSVSLF